MQLLALNFPSRAPSLVLISTSPVTAGNRSLPPPTAGFGQFAQLLWLEGADHGVQRADWDLITEAIATHTAASSNEQRSSI